jgi:hypothetical protein
MGGSAKGLKYGLSSVYEDGIRVPSPFLLGGSPIASRPNHSVNDRADLASQREHLRQRLLQRLGNG